jgi:hypothetical protein
MGGRSLHARFFATPDDLARAFSHSPELRACFDNNPTLPEAYTVLGMDMIERQVFGTALEGENIRSDVAQTSVSFSDHRVRICGSSDSGIRQELERRLVDQLALEGLAHLMTEHSRRGLLEQEGAMLKVRLQLLESRGAGVRSALEDDRVAEQTELSRLRAQLEENTQQLTGTGTSADTLGRELEDLHAVLSQPQEHLFVTRRRMRLDRMNIVQAENDPEAGTELEFLIARVPGNPPRMCAFTLARFPRAELLPAALLFEAAARELAL